MNGSYVREAKCDRCGLTRPMDKLLITPAQKTCKDPAVCARFKPLVAAVLELEKGKGKKK